MRRHATHTAAELFARTGPSALTGAQVKASLNTGAVGGRGPPEEPVRSPAWMRQGPEIGVKHLKIKFYSHIQTDRGAPGWNQRKAGFVTGFTQ